MFSLKTDTNKILGLNTTLPGKGWGKYTKANLRNRSPRTIVNNIKPTKPRKWWRSDDEFNYNPEWDFPDPDREEAEEMLRAYNLSDPFTNAGRTRRRRRNSKGKQTKSYSKRRY